MNLVLLLHDSIHLTITYRVLDDYVDSFGPSKCKDDNPTLFLCVSVEIRCETSWTFGLTDSMDMSILCSL